MRLLITITGLLLASQASAIFSFFRAVRIRAITFDGIKTHRVIFDYDKGYAYTDIDSQDIQEARIVNRPRNENVRCRYVDQFAPQANWLSDDFGFGESLRTAFQRPTGIICYIPDPDTVRIAVDPPMFGERVLNVKLPADPYLRRRTKTESIYRDYGDFATLNKATILDTMDDTVTCHVKYRDNLRLMFLMHSLNDEITRPLTKVTELWVAQERLPGMYLRRPNRSD